MSRAFSAFLIAALFALGASAQVQQFGPITTGHIPVYTTGLSPVIKDGGPALAGSITEMGITNTGTPFCINDGPITGPYHQLCLGANSNGLGLITYNAYGGASTLPLDCIINGVTTPCLVGSQQAIVSGTITGTLTGTNMPAGYPVATLAGVAVTSDTATMTVASSGIAADNIYHAFGGAGSGEASRIGIWSDLEQVGATPGGTGQHAFNTGIFSNVVHKFNAGGGPGNLGIYFGQSYGFAAQVANGPGATSFYGITGGEIDVTLNNNTTLIKEGWGVAAVPLAGFSDSNQGVGSSQGIGIWASSACGAGSLAGGSNCAGFTTALAFGRSDTYLPVPSTGTLIGVTAGLGTLRANYGIDFSNMAFNFCSFHGSGMCIDGAGNYQMLHTFPNIQLLDTQPTSPITTGGGYMRLAALGTTPDSFAFQINTAVAGDFSTAVTPLAFGSANTAPVIMSLLPASAGAGGLYVCVDNTGVLYKKSACP